MKSAFPGHYRPTKAEFRSIWRDCIFVLDANVLLNLYRYSPSTTSGLLKTLEAVAHRLWVPHQAAKEYHHKRLGVICEQARRYDQVLDAVVKARNDVESKLEARRLHPFSAPETQKEVMAHFTEIIDLLESCRKDHPDLLAEDTVLDSITALLEGKVGPPADEALCTLIERDGPQRYEEQVPPGYEDKGKTEGDVYGDLRLWLQIIEHAKVAEKPVVLVTDDAKGDWWWRIEDRTVGPRPELIEEFLLQTKATFYMYSTDRFMQYAAEQSIGELDQNAIDEVRELRKQAARRPKLRHPRPIGISDDVALDERHNSLMMQMAVLEHEIADHEAQRSRVRKRLRALESRRSETVDTAEKRLLARDLDHMRSEAAELDGRLSALYADGARISEALPALPNTIHYSSPFEPPAADGVQIEGMPDPGSSITAVSYDARHSILEVAFDAGRTYRCFGVPIREAEDFTEAPSSSIFIRRYLIRYQWDCTIS